MIGSGFGTSAARGARCELVRAARRRAGTAPRAAADAAGAGAHRLCEPKKPGAVGAGRDAGNGRRRPGATEGAARRWGGAGALGALAAAAVLAQAAAAPAAAYEPRTRHYYIAAERVTWDYAPSGENRIHPGEGLGPWGKKRAYTKTRYVGYQSEAFEKRIDRPAWRGILGPVIRGVVGDTIRIHFRNRAERPCSIHPIGTFYTQESEGAAYAGESHPGDAVAPGESHTYTLHVTEAVGPGPNDPSSILRLYRSHVDPVKDVYRGLVGPIILTKPEAARDEGSAKPRNVDRSFVTMFMVMDENAPGESAEGELMHAINGRIFGNLRGLRMETGETVRWHVFAMGSEVDLHTPHWHGNGVMLHGHRKENLLLQPAITRTVDMRPTNPGTWLFKCNVADHVDAGMMALYHVE